MVAASPVDWFEEESVRAALKWRYRPRDVAKLRDKRVKVQLKFVFE